MAGFPYGAARGLGAMQIFLGLAAIGLGIGDLILALSSYRINGSVLMLSWIGTGIWTGLFFLIAGSLAASISEGRTVGCKVGATQTMSLLNTFLFAPALTAVATISFIQSSIGMYDHNLYGNYNYSYASYRATTMFYLEITLTVVGCLEFIFSIATASVCCCGGSYDQPLTNQVMPMTYPVTVRQSTAPVPRQSYGPAVSAWHSGAPSATVNPRLSTGGDLHLVRITGSPAEVARYMRAMEEEE